MIVADASVVAPALGDDGPSGEQAREHLGRYELYAPELLDLEVVSAVRRAVRADRLTEQRAGQAVADLVELPLVRLSHRPLLARIWQLRDNFTPYDAAYVALAEALESALLTADRRLSRAVGSSCEVRLVK